MANNLLNKLLMKIFNKDKYSAYKFKKNSDKKLDFYNQNIKDEILKIDNSLNNKDKINFLHSGHLGDMVYSLPLIKELSKTKECNLYIQINKKMKLYYHNHPSGNVMVNNKTAKLMLPLLKYL